MTLTVDKIEGHSFGNTAHLWTPAKEDKVNAILATEDVLMPFISNKVECFGYKEELAYE